MDINFTPFFEQYENLVRQADQAFQHVKQKHSDCVQCALKCSDCCHALFDLTLIEALYINYHFNKCVEEKKKNLILDEANHADRAVYKIKKQAYKELENGKSETDIVKSMAEKRIRCPLLNQQNECILYDYRPITCRLYGIPLSINGASHTCGKSKFVEGVQYSTVNFDVIQNKLYEISSNFIMEIKSKYVKMSDMLVPLSMALLTIYNEEHLGIVHVDKTNNEEK